MKIVMIAEKPSVARSYVDALDLQSPKKQEGYIEGHSNWDDNDYIITWSFGHLVTLSYPEKYDEKYKNWNLDDLPFLPEKYKYEVIKTAAKQYRVVKELYHRDDVTQIVLAGDSGREGLYIQCLIKMLAGTNGKATEKVLWIDSQTEAEIRKGLKNMKPLSAYANLQNAGYMRAIEDYAFGLNYSRMLTCKFGKSFNKKVKSDKWKSINVGRVMTCVLGMVVNREREIREFKTTPFHKIYANCNNGKFEFSVDWYIHKESKFYDSPLLYDNKGFLTINDANDFIAELSKVPKLIVDKIEEKSEKKKAPLLYNLAELQNDCSKRFKIGPNETLEIAQKLYERKLTTYPRTDARFLSTAIAEEIETNLKGLQKSDYNKKFIDQILNFSMHSDIANTQYCNDAKITDHYAIIPTGYCDVSGLSDLELNVYHMIVDRFICIFLPQAEYINSTALLKAGNDELFKINEKALVKTGFLEVLKGKLEEEEEIDGERLSDFIKKGDVFDAEFLSEEGKTSPPKRYTSGSIILAMENAGNLIEDAELRSQIKGSGIGTSATRAGILEKLTQIGYININKKTQVITPHVDGETVYDIVNKTIPNFLSPKMTASWEKGLSQIEEGLTTKEAYRMILEKEIRNTCEIIKNITVEDEPEDTFISEETGFYCPYCGEPIVTTRTGYKCQANLGKDKGCDFFIGEICGVSISRTSLENLLNTGTSEVMTFKKKTGGTFDAMLRIDTENKKIVFKFPKNSQAQSEDTGLSCPFCNNKIVTTSNGFKCIKYKKDTGCSFYMSEIGEYKFNLADITALTTDGKAGPYWFKKKNGKGSYQASMVVNKEEKKIDFAF